LRRPAAVGSDPVGSAADAAESGVLFRVRAVDARRRRMFCLRFIVDRFVSLLLGGASISCLMGLVAWRMVLIVVPLWMVVLNEVCFVRDIASLL